MADVIKAITQRTREVMDSQLKMVINDLECGSVSFHISIHPLSAICIIPIGAYGVVPKLKQSKPNPSNWLSVMLGRDRFMQEIDKPQGNEVPN